LVQTLTPSGDPLGMRWRGLLLDETGDAGLGLARAEEAQLIGDGPRLLFNEGERTTTGQVLVPWATSVWERDPADDAPASITEQGITMLDAGATGAHVVAEQSSGPQDDGRLVRVALDGGRVVPLRGLVAGQLVEPTFGVVTDADTTTLAWATTPANRLILAECSSFADVRPSQAFAEDIEWVFAEGITTGYADSTYRPTGQVTRQAMAAFLHRLSGDPDP
ncbi:hypothetical protein B7486_71010, partial [cyanobacterium TDX16]